MQAREEQRPLHEFLAANRDRLLARVVEKLRERSPGSSDEQLRDGLPEVIDQIVRMLRRAAGLDAGEPKVREAGSHVGGRRQRDADDVSLVAFSIGAISDSMGELGKQADLSFHAGEYQVFNQCIDDGVAGAIEAYVGQERTQRDLQHSKRIGFLAHELRNALAGARIAYVNLKKGIFGINSKTGDVLGRSIDLMDRLVGQTLAAVRLEVGAPVQRQRIPLRAFLQRVDAGLRHERNVTTRWQVADDVVVEADESLLTSAAMNVIQNAYKFTHPGGAVTIRATTRDGDVSIEVEDECGGLPPGKEQEIFQPFVQQGDDRRGVGLGLPIAREAMEAQGGHVRVTDIPGKGCVFTLELPAPPGPTTS
jgi:signal transduction histidine kinase